MENGIQNNIKLMEEIRIPQKRDFINRKRKLNSSLSYEIKKGPLWKDGEKIENGTFNVWVTFNDFASRYGASRLRVDLIVKRRKVIKGVDLTNTPFSLYYEEPGLHSLDTYHVLIIICSPGLEIIFQNFRKINNIRIRLIYIQNPSLIPPLGSLINYNKYSLSETFYFKKSTGNIFYKSFVEKKYPLTKLGLLLLVSESKDLDNSPRIDSEWFQMATTIQVFPQENGVVIHHVYLGVIIRITLPPLVYDEKKYGSVTQKLETNERFSYSFHPETLLDSNKVQPFLKIIGTEKVNVCYSFIHPTYKIQLGRFHQFYIQQSLLYWSAVKLDDFYFFQREEFDGIPVQGAEYEKKLTNNSIMEFTDSPIGVLLNSSLTTNSDCSPDTVRQDLLFFATDVTIGLFPVLGDIVDIGEFIYASYSGRDRWGRKVNSTDLFLMGLFSLVPFISGSAVKDFNRVVSKL